MTTRNSPLRINELSRITRTLFRQHHHGVGLFVLIATLFVLSFLAGLQPPMQFRVFMAGEVADSDVVAHRSLTVEDTEAAKIKRNQVAMLQPTVFDLSVTEIAALRQKIFGMLKLINGQETSPEAQDALRASLAEKLATLSGKKLQSKRNLVNRFKAAYEGRWTYENMTKDNIKDAFAFHVHWCNLNGCALERDFQGETCAIVQALHNFDYLNLRGGLLRLDGEVIAFTFGCKATDDMYVVQIEKADSNIPGAYQMINQQFVQHECTGYQYVNREDDAGSEGLRKAKLSYRPAFLVEKGILTRKNA